MRFPRTQSDTVALADNMIAGFNEHADIFVHGDPIALQTARDQYAAASAALAEAQANAALAATAKAEKFERLQEEMKKQVKLAVVDTSDDPVELGYIGWGSKHEPQPIEAPAQPSSLKVVAQGTGMVCLSWRKGRSNAQHGQAHGCGPERCFVVQRRQFDEHGWSDWQPGATALNNEAKLLKQPTGCRLEYIVKAINAGGESFPSNTVSVIL